MRLHPTAGLCLDCLHAGYNPVFVDSIEAGKVEAAKLPPGAVVVTAMRLPDGSARELINWLKTEGFGFPVIAIVENLDPLDIVKVMSGGGASDIIQRRALDKQLVETVEKYAKPEMSVLTLDNQLLPRKSEAWRKIEEKITAIAATNANAIIFGECGSGKEQVAPKSTSTVRVSRNLTLSLKPGVPLSSVCMPRHLNAANSTTVSRLLSQSRFFGSLLIKRAVLFPDNGKIFSLAPQDFEWAVVIPLHPLSR